MLIEKPFEQMLEEIACTDCVFYDFWRPRDYPERHKSWTGFGKLYFGIAEPWIDGLLKLVIPESCGVRSDRMLSGAVLLALENSLTRGHNLDSHLPVSLKLFAGTNGVVIRLRDSGDGFPHQEYLQRRRAGDYTYQHGSGMGFMILDFPLLEVSYEGTGSVANIKALRGYSPEQSLDYLRKDAEEKERERKLLSG